MSVEWFVQIEYGSPTGPIDSATLKAWVGSGKVTPLTMVRKGIDGNWMAASKVKGLFEVTTAIPAPPPAPGSKPLQWYVTIEGEQKGPLTDKEIRRWISEGRVDSDTFVRNGGNGDWVPASSFPDLFAERAQPSGPPPRKESGQTREASPTDAKAIENPAIQRLREMLPILLIFLFLAGGLCSVIFLGAAPFLVVYFLLWIICGGVVGAIIGSFKQAGDVGAMLGALFGPLLGAIAAFAIDGRPQCSKCGGKLDAQPEMCPQCHERLAYPKEYSQEADAESDSVAKSKNLSEEDKIRIAAGKLVYAPKDKAGRVKVRVCFTRSMVGDIPSLKRIGFEEEQCGFLVKLLDGNGARIGTIDAARLEELACFAFVASVHAL